MSIESDLAYLKEQNQHLMNYIELSSWMNYLNKSGENTSMYKPLMDEIKKNVNNYNTSNLIPLHEQYTEAYT